MWKTTNYKGEAVTWYSEEEYNELLNKLKEYENEKHITICNCNNNDNRDIHN